jgi:hypothetical protein
MIYRQMVNNLPLPRLLEASLVDRLGRMPVVVLTGARQTGKTTLVQGFSGAASRHYETLDSLTTRDRALREPESLVATRQEIKASTAVRVADAKSLDAFCEEFPARAPLGLLLYDGAESLPLTKRVIAVPLGAIL